MAEAKMNAEKVVELVRKTASAQVDAAVKLEHKAVAGVKSAAKSSVQLAKKNPLAAAGIALGAGAVLGAIAHAVLAPKPTVRDTVMDALKDSANRVARRARRAVK